jgi:hypothetical protein
MIDAVQRRSLVIYVAWLFLGIFLYFYLSLFRNALIDDAFITLRYVKTLLASGTWGFFPGVVANSATSPLNVFLLAAISLFTGPTVKASLWLVLLCLFCMAWLLVHLSSHLTGSTIFGWLAVSGLIFNPLLISTIGLESILFTALFVLAVYCYQFQKWTGLGVALGTLTLARADGILFFLIFLLFAPATQTQKRLILVYLLCTIPWYLFSWIYLGSIVPDTFFIKTEQGTWWESDFFNGIKNAYYSIYPLEIILSFVFLPVTLSLFSKRVRDVMILLLIGLAGLTHFAGYSALGVPPFHWYYIPEVITIVLLGSLALGVLYRHSSGLWERRFWGAVTAICFLIPVLGMAHILGRDGFLVREMPIHSNWATHEQYQEIGLWLKDNYEGDPIRLEGGEIGTLAYYCDCRLLDRFSDRSWLKAYIAEHDSSPGLMSTLLKINFAFYEEPGLPSPLYFLRAYFRDPNIDTEFIKEWQTSTQWIPHGFLLLSRE